MRDLVVTGVPRGGTTLTAALIDSLADTVCLSEPPWQERWSREMADRQAYTERIVADFARVRAVLLAGGTIEDRRARDGTAITNYFRDDPSRPRTALFKIIPFRRDGLSDGFLLAMKQNAHYSCVLPELAAKRLMSVLVVLRHPIPTILSWRSLEIPISRGLLPAAEGFWPELSSIAASTADVLERQVKVYQLFCERYRMLADRLMLVRYEDLVADPEILATLLGRRYVRAVPVEQGRSRRRPDPIEVERIEEYLERYAPAARSFYPDLGAY